jgi:hypothetical protein
MKVHNAHAAAPPIGMDTNFVVEAAVFTTKPAATEVAAANETKFSRSTDVEALREVERRKIFLQGCAKLFDSCYGRR